MEKGFWEAAWVLGEVEKGFVFDALGPLKVELNRLLPRF